MNSCEIDLQVKMPSLKCALCYVYEYIKKQFHFYYSSGPEDDSESCLRNIKSQYDVFRSSSKSFKMLCVRLRFLCTTSGG